MSIPLKLILAALASLPILTFAATPAITSATGTPQTGQILQISGTNLNNEAKTNWDPFFTTNANAWSFEGQNPPADGYGHPGEQVTGKYDNTVSILGSQSMKYHLEGASVFNPDGSGQFFASDYIYTQGNDLWIRSYVRWSLNSGSWPSSHTKMLKVLGQEDGTTKASGIQPVPPDQMLVVHSNMGGNPQYFNIPSGPIEKNRWYALEFHARAGSNPVVEAWLDGVKVFDSATGPTPPGGVLQWIEFGVINSCCTDANFSLDHWVDGLTVASTRVFPSAMVEVGNSSNYATATKKTQALQKISDGQISSKLDLTGLGSGPYYLWVTNNRQERSQAYVLGQGAPAPVLDQGAPAPVLSPPTNLRTH